MAAVLAAIPLAVIGCAHPGAATRAPVPPEAEAPAEAAPPAPAPGAPRAGEAEVGLASFYGARFRGRRTASGERFDPRAFTAAHRHAPFGTRLRVTDLETGRSVIVTVNDRGPWVKGRVIDMSLAAARALGIVSRGVVRVRVEPLPDEEDDGGDRG